MTRPATFEFEGSQHTVAEIARILGQNLNPINEKGVRLRLAKGWKTLAEFREPLPRRINRAWNNKDSLK